MARRKRKKAPKKPETAGKKPETAALEAAQALFTQLKALVASPPTLSSSDVAEFQRTFSGIMNSASLITKSPLTNGHGNGDTGAHTNGDSIDLSVQYLEYKNSKLKDLIIEILLRK